MKTLVSLKLYRLTYEQLATLADTVYDGFVAASGVYVTPFPTTLSLQTAKTAMHSALSAWKPGGPGSKNRGSHQDLVNLRAARDQVRLLLTQLANYAEDTTPYDEVNLSSIGWPLKPQKHPVGVLNAVQNLRQLLRATNLPVGALKIMWDKPLNTVGVLVNSYRVFRGDTIVFADATQVAVTTRAQFVDLTPGSGIRFYFVIAVNAAGDGALSDPCVAQAKVAP